MEPVYRSQIYVFDITDENIGSPPVPKETLKDDLNSKCPDEAASSVLDTTLSVSKDEVSSDNPLKEQASHYQEVLGPNRRKRRKKTNWGASAYRRNKRHQSSKQISRAAYSVNYQYTVEGFIKNIQKEKLSFMNTFEVSPSVSQISRAVYPVNHQYTFEETLIEELNSKPTDEDALNILDTTLSVSRDEVSSDNPLKEQMSQYREVSGPNRRKRRKKNNWGVSTYRRNKRLQSSKQISRAVYPVNYRYTLEGCIENIGKENLSSERTIEVVPNVTDISEDDARDIVTRCERFQPQTFDSNGIVPDPGKRRNKRMGHNWISSHSTTRKKFSEQITKAKSSGNSQYSPRVSIPKGEIHSSLTVKTGVLYDASTDGGSVTSIRSYNCLLLDHNYYKTERIKVLSSSVDSSLKQPAEMDRNANEEPLNLYDHCSHDDREESASIVDDDITVCGNLQVILPSPHRDRDASSVCGQPSGRNQIDENANVSSAEFHSKNPAFWAKLESSVRSMLPFPWMTRISDGRLSLMRIPVQDNPVVEIGITFDSTDAHYFVHNRPLPVDHPLQSYGRHIGTQALRKAVDTVLEVFRIVLTMKICRGVPHHELSSNKITDGFIEDNLFLDRVGSLKMFRSQNCNLLVKGVSSCTECKKVADRLRRLKSQVVNRKFTQYPSKFRPNQYLGRV